MCWFGFFGWFICISKVLVCLVLVGLLVFMVLFGVLCSFLLVSCLIVWGDISLMFGVCGFVLLVWC